MRQDADGPRNGGFANPGPGFANGASRSAEVPRISIEVVACAVAVAAATVSGAFDTGDLPLLTRAAFWFVLIGWNLIKWHIWFALTVRHHRHWRAASIAGALLLNLSLPFEIELAFAAFGLERGLAFLPNYLVALLISAGIFALTFTIAPRLHRAASPAGEAPAADNMLLARVGVRDPAALLAIEAQDHYVRLRLADGRAPLIYRRFADALEDVRDLDGAQVRRGTWVAAHAVAGAERIARGWRLRLSDGGAVPVGGSFVGVARSRGWLG